MIKVTQDLMKLLLVHDHFFTVHDNGTVYSHQFSYEVLKRYLTTFTSVTMIGRARRTNEVAGLNIATGEGVRFVFVDNLSKPIRRLTSWRKVTGSIDSEVGDCDVVISRLPSELGLIAHRAAIRHKKISAVEVVGCGFSGLWHHGSLLGKLYAPVQFVRLRAAIRSAGGALYVTNKFLQSRYPPGEGALTCAVSDVQLTEVATQDVLERRSERYTRGNFVIGIIASLSADYKGVGDAIRAVKSLRDAGHDVSLRVLGGGDASRFSNLAASIGVCEFVHFDGVRTAGSAVFAWLDEVDIYAQPSLTEGLPRSLIEAMSRGLPAVGSNVGGIPDLLDPVYLHRAGDAGDLQRCLDSLITNTGRLVRSSKRSLEVAETYLSASLDARRVRFLRELAKVAATT